MISEQLKSIIRDGEGLTPQATPQATQQAAENIEKDKIDSLLEYCIEPRSRVEIQEFMGLKDREYFRSEILNPLIREGRLFPTIPDKPSSPNQKYYSKPRDKDHV
jgi:ATP-dependent DNA helicase RecG